MGFSDDILRPVAPIRLTIYAITLTFPKPNASASPGSPWSHTPSVARADLSHPPAGDTPPHLPVGEQGV